MRSGWRSSQPRLTRARTSRRSFAHTHLLSAFLCRCSFRYHNSRLFLGRKRETASASNCHPWISTYCAGLVLQSRIAEVEWPCVSGGLWEVEAVDCASAFSPLPFAAGLCVSQVKSDCVAQRRSCCNGMLAYYYVPCIILYTRPISPSLLLVLRFSRGNTATRQFARAFSAKESE